MAEVLLLTCLQANYIIGRVRLHSELSEPQKQELVREVLLMTKKGCFARGLKERDSLFTSTHHETCLPRMAPSQDQA